MLKILYQKNIFIGDKTEVLNSIKINEKIKEILNIISTIDDGVVGILLPRNINYILVILALWKSGRFLYHLIIIGQKNIRI